MKSLWAELKRRNVVKVAVAYAIVGWLLIQIAATMFPIFEAPNWILQVFTFFVILGFPIALVLSWIYDLTPEGIARTGGTGSKLSVVIVALMGLAIAYLGVNHYLLDGPELVAVEGTVSETVVDTVREIVGDQPPAPLTAIAVLPFDNLSPDPDNAYFASGMHEEILNALAKLSALEVEARTSVLRYVENRPAIEEIAADLGVGSILEGSVRFADNRVRVTTQLIDVSSGAHLWSETYEHEFEDIFAIESDVAMSVANALEAEFSEEEQQAIYTPRSRSPAALALLWQAMETVRTDLADAFAALDRAIELDPEFSVAYTLRAWFNTSRLGQRFVQAADDPEAYVADLEERITADIERALALDPAMGPAYTVMAIVHERSGRGVEARAAHERSYELMPNVPEVLLAFSRFSLRTGRFDEAARLIQEAFRQDRGVQPEYWRQLGDARFYAGDLDAAEAAYRVLVDLSPAGDGHFRLGRVEGVRGNGEEAFAYFQIDEEIRQGSNASRLSELTLWYSVAGYPEEAERTYEALERALERSPLAGTMPLALANLGIGNVDESLRLLRQTLADENRGVGLSETPFIIKFNLANLPVLDEPEFVEVRMRLGFTE